MRRIDSIPEILETLTLGDANELCDETTLVTGLPEIAEMEANKDNISVLAGLIN